MCTYVEEVSDVVGVELCEKILVSGVLYMWLPGGVLSSKSVPEIWVLLVESKTCTKTGKKKGSIDSPLEKNVEVSAERPSEKDVASKGGHISGKDGSGRKSRLELWYDWLKVTPMIVASRVCAVWSNADPL